MFIRSDVNHPYPNFRPVSILKEHNQPIFALGLSNTCRKALSGGGDSSIVSYGINDAEDNKHVLTVGTTVQLPSSGTSCIQHRADDRIVASSNWDGSLRLFEAKKMKCLAILK